MLFTHWGLSGPAVLKLSAFAARFLNERNYRFHGMINFIPDMRISQFKEWIEEKRKYAGGRHIRNSVPANLPQRLWDLICKRTGVEMKNWADGTRKELDLLISNTTQFSFHAHGKTTFKEEFVTCGGVDLKEVNMRTMESKKIPGLFFAGEVLDIDGITGGYNFQAAWTTGYIAGISAGNK
jgi:predicted Rossmann fold flavoprotein